MATDELGPGQKYTIQAQKRIASRASRPETRIEFRWYPAHKGVAGGEKADEWTELEAKGSGANGPWGGMVGLQLPVWEGGCHHPDRWPTSAGKSQERSERKTRPG